MKSSGVPVVFETSETLAVLADWRLGVGPLDLSKSPSRGNMGWKQDGSGMSGAFSKLDKQ